MACRFGATQGRGAVPSPLFLQSPVFARAPIARAPIARAPVFGVRKAVAHLCAQQAPVEKSSVKEAPVRKTFIKRPSVFIVSVFIIVAHAFSFCLVLRCMPGSGSVCRQTRMMAGFASRAAGRYSPSL
jgi:hypothetical protein